MTPRFVGYSFAVLVSLAVHAAWIGAAVTWYQVNHADPATVVAGKDAPLG